MTIVEQISANRRRTFFLFLGFLVLYAAIGWAASLFWGSQGMIIVAALAVLLVLVSLFWGDDMAVKVAGGKQVTSRDQAPALWDSVETAAIAAGLQMPRVFISPDRTPNAFAAGRNHGQALVCANLGLLEVLDKEELQGVMAHEIAHIQNHDVRLMTYVAVLAGSLAILSYFVSRMFIFGGASQRDNGGGGNIIVLVIALLAVILAPIAATIIQMAISRKREYLADAQASDLTRYPQGLASALETISGSATKEQRGEAKSATAHMYFAPLALESRGLTGKMFSTHPPTEERVRRLLDLSGGVRHERRKDPAGSGGLNGNPVPR